MIIILKPDVAPDGPEVQALVTQASRYPNIATKVHSYRGENHLLTEVHLIGETKVVPAEPFAEQPFVVRVVRVSEKYRVLGRHNGQVDAVGFEYRGIRFGQDTLNVFPGLCAVDNRENVEATFKAIGAAGVKTARMGAYKPRTSPYDFQGHGKDCLPYVFELAGKYGIEVVAMEITREQHLDEIREALRQVGHPTGVMLQIGTRNAQNFELLKVVGQQKEFPVLFKRGMGITLEEALNACEYVASEGNSSIVFCLRGVKSHLGAPHRNMIDFAHVPVIKRLTRMPVCVDPSHSAGRRTITPDGMTEIHHATAEGVIIGANMVLVDFHPDPAHALCDGPQALTLEELPAFLDDVRLVRQTYLARLERAKARATA
ncbi:3-deoxy-7-phosphoheptulonate synthase [Pendulispora brunnea]|uniref:3-deoxy-7-phosphoheptulonate synthase n=1 Tax=Pendulispora brunnea TaxID=2905690 RepID=A0ABZ2KEQ0_9BACT